jgi:hypothetical protein
MRLVKLFALLCISSILLTGCGDSDPPEIVGTDIGPPINEETYENDAGVWAKDNFDLQPIGSVLEESDDIGDFERRLNSDARFNNLDLNGDGNVDYISVREFEDRNDNQRGFSLFSRFDGDAIQEIASIFFDRDRPDRNGARVYVRGNEQMYGDNFGYEANWLDKSLNISRYIFSNRDDYYESPYYDDNYPDYYGEYPVLETPIYRQRITKYMVNPAMTKITTPTMKIKIKSPYPGRSYNRAYAKMAKPTKEQITFYKNKPKKDKPEKGAKNKSSKVDGKDNDVDKPGKPDQAQGKGKVDQGPKNNKPPKAKKQEKPGKSEKVKKQNNKPPKAEKKNKGAGKGKDKGEKKGKN